MSVEVLLNRLPEYARDLKLNLNTLLQQTELNPQQCWGTAVASALASRNRELFQVIEREATQHLSPEALQAAKTAAALMGMNNTYYRFQHLAHGQRYRTIPSHLRMNGLRAHGIHRADFELWCVAVSALNGCDLCVAAHEKILLDKGVTEETILSVVRIASVVYAVASVMDVENL